VILQCLTRALHRLPIARARPDIMPGMSRKILLVLAWLASCSVAAAEFTVTPIRVDLQRGARSAAVTVANDAATALRMELRLMEWTQDAEGKDVHRPSDELVYYPRQMTLQPGERRLVRIGRKAPAAAAERTFRLYLDELPGAPGLTPATSGLTFTIRFALPVFVEPAQETVRGAIDSISMRDGKVNVALRNAGNRTFRIASVAIRGGAFTAEAAGWYLLPGAARVHTFEIPPEVCRSLRRIEIAVKADGVSLEGGLDVDTAMCPH
jgi:fimbrial chaperone protein